MALIPNNNTTIKKINSCGLKPDKVRGYLGMSNLGHECVRFLQYSFSKAYKSSISKRNERIFDLGHILEIEIKDYLEEVGVNITRDQLELIGFSGHAKGHIDGIALGVIESPKEEMLFEAKSHNDKSFKLLQKQGVKKSKPVHYAQVQRYMDLLKLKNALYIAYNKNDSDIYIEIIPASEFTQELLAKKEKHIIMSETLDKRVGNVDYYTCNWCDAKNICHNDFPVNLNCRTCKFVELHNEGVWKCAFRKRDLLLNLKKQIKGCKDYKVDDRFK